MQTPRPPAPAPLYEDPIHHGPADPRLFWNPLERTWWMLYTSRRATHEGPGVAWGFGTPIGVASSDDGGAHWTFRGTLDLRVKGDGETFWGPEIVCHDGLFHLFPVYYEGASTTWDVPFQPLAHFVSTDLRRWTFEGFLQLGGNKIIEGCVLRMPDGRWRMWYRRDVHFETADTWTEESQSMTTWMAESDDLADWRVVGPAVADIPHEGAKVFRLGGSYWMLTDAWQGLGVYRSEDGDRWQRQEGFVLDAGGSRDQDGARAHNPCVRVIGDTAYVIYHTHPEERDYDALWADGAPFALRRSVIQVAEAHVVDGRLVVERDHSRFALPPDGPDMG